MSVLPAISPPVQLLHLLTAKHLVGSEVGANTLDSWAAVQAASQNASMGPLSKGYHRARCVCRLLLLDMLLGNPDRFPCEALGWRGNPNNVLYCSHGRLQVHVPCT